jgi:hypothetical protein
MVRMILLYGFVMSMYKHSTQPILWSIAAALGVSIILDPMISPAPVYLDHDHRGLASSESAELHDGYRVAYDTGTGTSCREPALHNPFANPMVGDTTERFIPACDLTPERVQKQERYFEDGLPLDRWDVFRKNNSQRQFYTVTVNDQAKYAEWLYGSTNK